MQLTDLISGFADHPAVRAVRDVRNAVTTADALTPGDQREIVAKLDRIEQLICIVLMRQDLADERIARLKGELDRRKQAGTLVEAAVSLLKDDGTNAPGCEPECGGSGGCGDRNNGTGTKATVGATLEG